MTGARLALLALTAAFALAATKAPAGDFADLESFGFSADGRVYAFGQSGIQDGSGFPYADIVFVDLAADAVLPPSPIRVRLEEDGATPQTARETARRSAAALFAAHAPQDNPGRLLVSNPATELSADPYRAVFRPRPIEPSPDRDIEIRLEPIPLGAGSDCAGMTDTVYGFRLVRVATRPGESAVVLHENQTLPASRACALDYRLSEIRVADTAGGSRVGVVLVGVKRVGFEGPDLRFLAVPLALD